MSKKTKERKGYAWGHGACVCFLLSNSWCLLTLGATQKFPFCEDLQKQIKVTDSGLILTWYRLGLRLHFHIDLVFKLVTELYWFWLALCWKGVLHCSLSSSLLWTNGNIIKLKKYTFMTQVHTFWVVQFFTALRYALQLSFKECCLPGSWPIKSRFIHYFFWKHI